MSIVRHQFKIACLDLWNHKWLHNFSAPSFKVKLFHLLSHKSEVCIHLAGDHRNLESTEFGTGKSGVVSYLVNI